MLVTALSPKVGYDNAAKNAKSTTPTSNERNYAQHDKFWCMPLPKNKYYKRCVDFQNDVYVSDIELAVREGFDLSNSLKDIQHLAWLQIKEKQVT